MMRLIIAWSMQLRLVVLAAAAVLLYFGFTRLPDMPVDVLPEFSRPYVEVQTEALGLSAAEVEAMITVPLEADMLNGVSWVEEIRSESIPGLSSVVLFFEPQVDLLTARQMVMERLTETHTLPSVAKPPKMLNPVSSTSRFLKVGVKSDEHSLIDLSVLAHWTIVPRLMGVPGVAHVSVWGQRERQLQVQVDPHELYEKGVRLDQIIATAGNALWVSPLSFLDASTPGTGGWIETPNQRLQIQHLLPITNADELSRVVVQGTNYTLADVASVVEDHQPLIGDAIVDHEPALMLVVEKFPWVNTVEVTHEVEKALASLELGLPGVKLDPSLFRPASYLEQATSNFSTALLLGLVLALVVLFGLLMEWRVALISGLSLVLSVVAAGAVLYTLGEPINMLIIAGLAMALAALIDDAVIDAQNIARRLADRRPGDDERSRPVRIFEAALEMRSPAAYATVIVLLALVPVYLMSGVAAAFSQPLVAAYGLALLASLVVALTVPPALSLLLLGGEAEEPRESPVLAGLKGALADALPRSAPGMGLKLGVAVVGAIVLAALVTVPRGEAVHSVLPTFQERDILVDLDGAPGTSEEAMSRVIGRATEQIETLPGVRRVSAHVGRAVMSDRTSDVSSAELWVSVDEGVDYDATVGAIRAVMSDFPGFDVDVATYLDERVLEESEEDEALVVRVYGENLDAIHEKAKEVRGLLRRVDGVVDPEVEAPAVHASVEIEVDLEKAKRYGVKPGDVRRASTTLLSGLEVGNLFQDQKVFQVVVWSKPELRENVSDVENLLIDTPTRGQVRLKDVADVRIATAPKVIDRDAVARHVDIKAGVDGDPSAVVAEIERRLRSEVHFPLEFRAEVLSDFEDGIAAQRRTTAFAIAAAIGVLLLLQAAFGSWSLAAFFFLSLPVALLGGVAAAFLTGEPTTLGCLLGLVAVFAIATRNGITLVRHYRALEKREGGFSPELVARATGERVGPILTTALVTAALFLPMLFMGGIAGLEILHPLAITVLGGLVTSTAVTLFVVPGLYLADGAEVEPDVLVEEEPPRLVA